MNILRTPENNFDKCPDFAFPSKYISTSDEIRMHYIDTEEGEPAIVMLHGEPSWSFLYRKMIKAFSNSGWRSLAPDLVGFGKSDKLTDPDLYTFSSQQGWLEEWFDQIDCPSFYLFLQDWGGLLGLRIAVKLQKRIKGLIIANTFLPAGYSQPNEAFIQWREFSQKVPVFPVGKILQMATTSELSKEVVAAYDAPFPDETYKVAARKFPALVPFDFDDPECQKNRKVWEQLGEWNIPTLTLFSDGDPIMSGLEKVFQDRILGSVGQPHTIIKDAGHFLQEDKGEEIAEYIVKWHESL
jgi:haloalkane dehalogenase